MTRINELMRSVSNLYNIEPIIIELMKDENTTVKTSDELSHEALEALESTIFFLILV